MIRYIVSLDRIFLFWLADLTELDSLPTVVLSKLLGIRKR